MNANSSHCDIIIVKSNANSIGISSSFCGASNIGYLYLMDITHIDYGINKLINLMVTTFGNFGSCAITWQGFIADMTKEAIIRSGLCVYTSQVPNVITIAQELPTHDCGSYPTNSNTWNVADLENHQRRMTISPVLVQPSSSTPSSVPEVSTSKLLDTIAEKLIIHRDTYQNVPELHPSNTKGRKRLCNFIACNLGYNISERDVTQLIIVLIAKLEIV